MIGDSLNIHNLESIKREMDKISKNDRSQFFNNYYKEITDRLSSLYKVYSKYTCINCGEPFIIQNTKETIHLDVLPNECRFCGLTDVLEKCINK
jgi:formylmethanofuran dehydrogenase subunit E